MGLHGISFGGNFLIAGFAARLNCEDPLQGAQSKPKNSYFCASLPSHAPAHWRNGYISPPDESALDPPICVANTGSRGQDPVRYRGGCKERLRHQFGKATDENGVFLDSNYLGLVIINPLSDRDTQILNELDKGDRRNAASLLPQVYDELRRIDDALDKLEQDDPKVAELVKLHFLSV
jgi:hypothetical protein